MFVMMVFLLYSLEVDSGCLVGLLPCYQKNVARYLNSGSLAKDFDERHVT
jgi:hypothetical protein